MYIFPVKVFFNSLQIIMYFKNWNKSIQYPVVAIDKTVTKGWMMIKAGLLWLFLWLKGIKNWPFRNVK